MPLILRPWFVQKRAHRVWRDIALRSRGGLLDGLIWIIGVVGPFVLTIFGVQDPLSRKWGWGLSVCLLALVVARLVLAEGREHVRRKQLWGCLGSLHERVFANDPAFRFTFFICDPVACVSKLDANGTRRRDEILVPFVRRSSGSTWSMSVDSTVFYPRSSSAVTSVAWNNASSVKNGIQSSDLSPWVTTFPPFKTREDMEHYYKETLGIEEEIVKRVGDSMIRARAILSFPIVDSHGTPLGLLSIDLLGRELALGNPDAAGTGSAGAAAALSPQISVDQRALVEHIEMMRSMLIHAWN